MTLTLANIPGEIGEALRVRAEIEGKGLDQIAIEAIQAGLGLKQGARKVRDLSEFAGSWIADPEVEAALRDQDQLDPELWK